ncbi:MAG: hypoxanthine phosphoribosyltransferase [Bacillota bacterium]|nr:MAG: hypoxanthine phosphoribosyltransferase [Bacillota bacterium]
MADYVEEVRQEILLPAETIQARVTELGRQISSDYRGRHVFLVGVLKGAWVFLADLARNLTVPASFDFMSVSSYGSATKTSGVVQILKDLEESIEGRDVIIVEDIVDTGLTLSYLVSLLQTRKPASLRVCVLLDKSSRRTTAVPLDYVGFEIPDAFVVGYGLDYSGRYRNVPYIFTLRPEVYS